MKLVSKFYTGAWLMVAVLGTIAAANLTADALSPNRLRFANAFGPLANGSQTETACWASEISFARTDLKVECALARSARALKASRESASEMNKIAQTSVVQTLSGAPYESELWLALALLQSQANQLNGEALKMSYLTAPSDIELVPLRLAEVVSKDALADLDLRTLAVGDIRLILMRRPDLKVAIVDAYRKASSIGKPFLKESTNKLDPEFSAALHTEK